MNLIDIEERLIILFLERLFEECGCSLFETKKVLKNYAYEGIKIFPLEIDEDCEDDCPIVRELHKRISNLKNEIKKLESEVKVRKNNNKENWRKYLSMKKKYDKLRENSVIFSMDM